MKYKEALLQIGKSIAVKMQEKDEMNWCFFSGFSFILCGIEKETNDIDILAKDSRTFGRMQKTVRDMGFRITNDEGISKFFKSESGIKIDLFENHVWSFILPPTFWEDISYVDLHGVKMPIPKDLDMVILKAIVYSGREKNDPKKRRDLIDTKELIKRRNISVDDVLSRAAVYNIDQTVSDFLKNVY